MVYTITLSRDGFKGLKIGSGYSNQGSCPMRFTRKSLMYRQLNKIMGSIIKILVKCLYKIFEKVVPRLVPEVVLEAVPLRLSLKNAINYYFRTIGQEIPIKGQRAEKGVFICIHIYVQMLKRGYMLWYLMKTGAVLTSRPIQEGYVHVGK